MARFFFLACAAACTFIASAQTDYDARILSYEGLDRTCDGELLPVLRIQNVGNVTMGSCVIDIWKNGVNEGAFNWILGVPAATGEVRQPALPVMSGLQEGDELEFEILSVNGEADEDEDGNHIMRVVQGESEAADSYRVLVEVRTDDNPEETTWSLLGPTGQVIASGGPYEDPGAVERQWVELDAETCYGFRLEDSGGDGLSQRSEGASYAKVIALGQEVLSVSGDGFSDVFESALRTAEEGCAVTRLTTADDHVPTCNTAVYINGGSVLRARPVDGADRYQFRFTWGNYARNIAVEGPELTLVPWVTNPLKPGRFYAVQVRVSFDGGANWCPWGPSCPVRTLFPANTQFRHADALVEELEPGMRLAPNPTDGGTLDLWTTLPVGLEGMARMEVMDMTGRLVHASVFTAQEGEVRHPISFHQGLLPGMYLVTVRTDAVRMTERLLVR